VVPADDRWRKRLEQERPLLAQAFPTADLDIDIGVVIVRGHILPPGWSHHETDALVEIPAKYPSTPPDNICARPELTLADGRVPGSNQGHRDIAGGRWLQFSYHVDAADWRTDVDLAKSSTLVDYLHGALTRFEEAT
jgi:hypothetical protein